jgi:hypothetical protein
MLPSLLSRHLARFSPSIWCSRSYAALICTVSAIKVAEVSRLVNLCAFGAYTHTNSLLHTGFLIMLFEPSNDISYLRNIPGASLSPPGVRSVVRPIQDLFLRYLFPSHQLHSPTIISQPTRGHLEHCTTTASNP